MSSIQAHPPKNGTPPPTACCAPSEDTMVLSIPRAFVGHRVRVAIRIPMQQGNKLGFPFLIGTLEECDANGLTVRTTDNTLMGPPGMTWALASDVIGVTMASSIHLADSLPG